MMKCFGGLLILLVAGCATGAATEENGIGIDGSPNPLSIDAAVPPIDAPSTPSIDAGAVDSSTACTNQWVNLLQNPAFDLGQVNWTEETAYGIIMTFPPSEIPTLTPHSPTYGAWMGGAPPNQSDKLHQSVAVPAGATMLRVKGQKRFATADASGDTLKIELRNAGGGTVLETLQTWNSSGIGLGDGAWVAFEYAAAASHANTTIELWFTMLLDADQDNTNFFLDTIALEAYVCQ